MLFTDFQGSPDSIKPWHHNINNQQIYLFFFQNGKCLLTVISFQKLMSLLFQIDADGLHDLFIVITNKNYCHFLFHLPCNL